MAKTEIVPVPNTLAPVASGTRTFDVCLSPKGKPLGATVLLTVTDEKAAQAIADAVNAAPIFQGDGLKAFSLEVDRVSEPSVTDLGLAVDVSGAIVDASPASVKAGRSSAPAVAEG